MRNYNLFQILIIPLVIFQSAIGNIVDSKSNITCELNIGLNKFSAFIGKGIYHNGNIDASFLSNSSSLYRSPVNNIIDYFYVTEKIQTNWNLASTYEHIKIDINAFNESVLVPLIKYIPHKGIALEVQTGEIEIAYNCKVNEGESVITMKLYPYSCPSFELKWIKECRSTRSSLTPVALAFASIGYPLIDISLNQDNVFINGTQINSHIFTRQSDTPYIIASKRINIYITNRNPREIYILRPIEIYHSSMRGFGYITRGFLSRGIQIPLYKTTMSIDFICLVPGMADVVLSFSFEGSYESIKLFFKKECPQRRSIAIGLLTFFFWFFVAIVISLILLCCLVYSLQNPFICIEVYNSFMSLIRGVKNKAMQMQYSTLPSKSHNERDKISKGDDKEAMKPFGDTDGHDEEGDMTISYQIKVSNRKEAKDEQMPIEIFKNDSMNDYGGI